MAVPTAKRQVKPRENGGRGRLIDLPGIRWNGEEQVASALKIRKRDEEFNKLFGGAGSPYNIRNGLMGEDDAHALYEVVLTAKPKYIIEVGSGNSSRLFRAALDRLDNLGMLACIDPEPRIPVDGVADVHFTNPVQDMPLECFADLKANDILYIDAEHRIATAGGQAFLVLEVLPALARGVIVGWHDIVLPREYDIDNPGWTEQYILGALLIDNPKFDVLWSGGWMLEARPDLLLKGTPGKRQAAGLWLKKSA